MEPSVLMRTSLAHCPTSSSAEACASEEAIGADASTIAMASSENALVQGNPSVAQGAPVECPAQILPLTKPLDGLKNSCFLVLSVNDTAQANLNNSLSPESIVLVTNKCNGSQPVNSIAGSLPVDEPRNNSSETAATYCSVSGGPLGGKVKEDRRRLNHNQVEKRRREKINELISKLGSMVLGNKFHTNREFSKSTILARVMDHLVELQHAACKLPQTARTIEAWTIRLSTMKQQITAMEEENRKLRSLLMEIAGQSNNLKEEPTDK